MPRSRIITDAERVYLEDRLSLVIKALRENTHLQEEFLLFSKRRGSSFDLTLTRLKTVWWKGRKSMYPGFFVLALVEFGLAHGLFVPEGRGGLRGRG